MSCQNSDVGTGTVPHHTWTSPSNPDSYEAGLLLTSASESSARASYMAVRLGDAVWPCSYTLILFLQSRGVVSKLSIGNCPCTVPAIQWCLGIF